MQLSATKSGQRSASWKARSSRALMLRRSADSAKSWSCTAKMDISTSLPPAANCSLTSTKRIVLPRRWNICSMFRLRRMSLLHSSAICSSAIWSHVMPSRADTTASRFATICLVGRRKAMSTQWPCSERSFMLYLSLQMQMMGILLMPMVLMRSATPPRSPADMPSTSSMMSSVLVTSAMPPPARPNENVRLVTNSRTRFAVEPPTPLSTSPCALPRASDALTSITVYPPALAMSLAIDVLPMPGGPLISTAFLGPFLSDTLGLTPRLLNVASHDLSQLSSRSDDALPPTRSPASLGAHLSVHSSPATAPADWPADLPVTDPLPLPAAKAAGAAGGLSAGGGRSATGGPFLVTIAKTPSSSITSTPSPSAAATFFSPGSSPRTK
mmetsp:Transcript_8138/g.25068  ORF Transcript_8138/g.25068 Transcript_8138/m.25068 type:complete len:384 (+) Transcript_8138:2316-3467(+)